MKKYVIIMILTVAFVLQGCALKEETSKATNNSESTELDATEESSAKVELEEKSSSDEKASNTGTDSNTEANKITPEATVAPVKTDLILPVTGNDTGKVLIQTVNRNTSYPFTSYIITSINGESVVVDPTQMPAKEIVDINPAAILGTHSHPDHTDSVFTKTYDVPKILFEKGEIQTKDYRIYSILSSHSNDTIAESNKNVIIVFEVDGLRIAHMGDVGQTKLTDEQLTELGEIDIAFMQFENSYSSMTLDNAKGFTMIEQLNPKIVIPTHFTEKALPVLEEKYGALTEYENILEISKEELPDSNMNIYRISNNHKYN
ncbi:MAG: MBL fold metallo-hydrolase [Mobilitalea sp.]